MPPLPDAPDVVVTKQFWTVGDHTAEMMAHWKYTGGPISVDDLVLLSTVWQTQWEDNWINVGGEFVSADVSSQFTTSTDLSTADSNFGQYTHTATGNSDERTSADNAILLSHSIGLRYRGGHPRTYLLGATNDNIADGSQTWIDAATAAALNAWTVAKDAVEAIAFGSIGSIAGGALSYFSGGALRVSPLFLPFVDTVVSDIIRSQRRRVRRTPTPT